MLAKVIILVCLEQLSPADCRPDTALDVISGPQVAGIAACAMAGQATMAETGLDRRAGEYIKIRCEPSGETRTAARF